MLSQWFGKSTAERDVPHIHLADDDHLKEIYIFGRKLGRGSFGVVYQATHIETKTQWAIKKVRKPEPGSSKVKMLEQEIEILKQVNHAHIIHLKEIYETAKMTYLVTELCVGGELKQLLQRKKFFTEDETRHIIRSLADAIVYLHKRDIVHRDLKLENILVNNPFGEDVNGNINIKVTDFGLAVVTGGVGIENMMTDTCGTITYMAPEMMSGRGYSHWCDMWSIGVIMYMLLCGEPPFVSSTTETLVEKIKSEQVTYTQPTWASVSDTAKNLLTCLLKKEPAYRMSANQLLENPWITGDTNSPAMPVNALEMMLQYKEQEDTEWTEEQRARDGTDGENDRPEQLEDTGGTSSACKATSAERDCGCGKSMKLSTGREENFCKLPTAKLCKDKGGHPPRDKSKDVCQTQAPPQPTTSQTHAVVKPSRQSSAKQRRPQEKRDTSNVQRLLSDKARSDHQKQFSSFDSKIDSRKPHGSCKTAVPLKTRLKKSSSSHSGETELISKIK